MNIQENWLPILILIIAGLCVIGYIIYLAITKGLKETALNAILEAEKQYNTTTGKERLELAVSYAYDLLPKVVKVILPKTLLLEMLHNFIQKTFNKIKDLLDYHREELQEAKLEIAKLKGELKNEA